jgi:hypothetical protein
MEIRHKSPPVFSPPKQTTTVIPPPPASTAKMVIPPPPPPVTTPLQHAEAWWKETLASAPPLSQLGLREHIESQWSKLEARLK